MLHLLDELQQAIPIDAVQEPASELSDPATPKQSASGTRYGLSPSHHLQPPSPSRLRQETPFTGALPGSPAPQAVDPSTAANGLHSLHNQHQVLDTAVVVSSLGG